MSLPTEVKMLVIGGPSPELAVLKKLPANVHILQVGRCLADFSNLSEAEWASVTVLLNCGVGVNAGKKEDVQQIWPKLTNLKWMHSSSAGLEHLLFPELVSSSVVLTNAKGVYSNSLAEFALMGCKYFAMDVPRLLRAKAAKTWEPYDVEELRGRTLGVIGLGDIGTATAKLAANGYQMRVLGLRRSTALVEDEGSYVEKIYPPSEICALVAQCDYVVTSTPYTASTHELVSAAAFAAMKPNCVFINVGRGKCVHEAALVGALQAGKIKGAALDVFAVEPLPADSPLWTMDSVLMSPHNADRTSDFQFETLKFFVKNMAERFLIGEELWNVCDKGRGY
ncbi:hypothetical protein FOA52_005260 [Chlamydomonas sp. UWO 241]|nr:hypothetical protein FOA52_005260 [Chlamydomonas sp. UWO 241]